jgi:hypothetical protein
MKILVVDSVPIASSTLASYLRKVLGYDVLCASSATETLQWLTIEKDVIGVVIVFLDIPPGAGLASVQRIREFCSAAALRIPRFLILTPGPIAPGYESKFRIAGAECLLYGFMQQVQVTVRRMLFEVLCEKGRATILVDRSGPDSKFLVSGVVRPELISCGCRLLPILNRFAVSCGTELSTLTLAEVADITVGSVRVYLSRLRARFDEARIKVGVNTPGSEVFCTRRKDGAFVHVLTARVIFL